MDDDCLFSIVVVVVCAGVAVAVADVVAGFKADVMAEGAVVAIANVVVVTAVIADAVAGFKTGAVVVDEYVFDVIVADVVAGCKPDVMVVGDVVTNCKAGIDVAILCH